MSTVARTYTFTDGTTAYGSQVETEFSTIYTAWNNHDAGTSTWTLVKSAGFVSSAVGTAAAPNWYVSGAATTGAYIASAAVGLTRSGVVGILTTTTDFELYPDTSGTNFVQGTNTPDLVGRPNNTWNLGNSSFRWKEVFATNGTINTCISTAKTDISRLDDIPVPPAARFRRLKADGQPSSHFYLGYIADDLPEEAFYRDEKGIVHKDLIYSVAIEGILCANVRKLWKEVENLKELVGKWN